MISTPSTFKAQSAERTGKAVRQPGRVAFVGAGPGDPGLLTLRAAEYLAEADVVVIDQVSREDFVARYARPDVEIIDAGHGGQIGRGACGERVLMLAVAEDAKQDKTD